MLGCAPRKNKRNGGTKILMKKEKMHVKNKLWGKMCGIVGILFREASPLNLGHMMHALREMQNRGYDSMGISVLEEGRFHIEKAIGSESSDVLDEALSRLAFDPKNCIGHTRWATHGGVSIANAHPHLDGVLGKFTLAHNGIIENFLELRTRLREEGYESRSDTDTEVALNWMVLHYKKLCESEPDLDDELRVKRAILASVQDWEGTYGFVFQAMDHPDKLFCIRKGSPLLLGTDSKQRTLMIVSERQAFPRFISRYLWLNSNDLVVCRFHNEDLIREFHGSSQVSHPHEDVSLGSFRYFTEKEIFDQTDIVYRTTKRGSRLILPDRVRLGGLDAQKQRLAACRSVLFFGCGTSHHACLILQHFFLTFLDFENVLVFDASDFHPIFLPRSAAMRCGIFLSQSGETRDLIVAHRHFVDHNVHHVALGATNTVDSVLSTLTDAGLYTNAGREKGVASTKSFLAQIVCGLLILLWFHQTLQPENRDPRMDLCRSLRSLDRVIADWLPDLHREIPARLLPALRGYSKMFVMGRGIDYYVAMEGSLKIKEIAYRHAEAYSSGSLKHGPFALLDEDYLVIFILTEESEENVRKVMNSIQEILARKAKILLLITPGISPPVSPDIHLLPIPSHPLGFLLAAIALQVFSFHLSIDSGINPDFPRNLAKVVTVE